MEEEIDLREYVKVLIRWWKLIAGVTLAAVAVVAAVSFLQPTVYEATATVGWRMAGDGAVGVGASTAKAVPAPAISLSELALGEDLLDSLASQLGPLVKGMPGATDLREALGANASADGSTVQLTARSTDAGEAALVVSTWADALVRRASDAYDEEKAQEAEALETQAKSVLVTLDKAEQALVEHLERSRLAILEAQRDAAEQSLRDSLAEQREIARAIQEARDLQARLAGQPADAPVKPEDALTAVFVQAQAAGMNSAGQMPVHVQLSDTVMASIGQTAGEVSASLDRLVANLTVRSDQLAALSAAQEARLPALQVEVQRAQLERDRLAADVDVARNVYASLAERAAEARAATSGDQARLVAPAAVSGPVGQSRLFNVVVAGVLGLMLGVFGAFAIEWWRGGAQGESKAGGAQA